VNCGPIYLFAAKIPLFMRKTLTAFSVGTMLFLFLASCSDDATNPRLTTTDAINITQTSATAGGIIDSDGGSELIVRGLCWSTSADPTTNDSKIEVGSGVVSFSGNLTQLTEGTTYFVRAYATNAQGTGYGQSVSFTTQDAIIPTVTTTQPTNVSLILATAGGEITADGGSAITGRGVCWSTHANPTVADSKTVEVPGFGSFASLLTALTEGTTYYVKAYATNIAGTGYGDAIAFTTSVTDVEGNVYGTVHIGTQVWMKENLKTARYANGEPIATTTPATLHLGGQISPKYQWDYNGESSNAAVYGKLYTWFAVADERKLCPYGWHVPSDAEWTTMGTVVGGGQGFYGGKLKEAGTSHWQAPNTEATNSTGFTALPGGNRDESGPFLLMGAKATWWSATEVDASAWYRMLSHDNSSFTRTSTIKYRGQSVRCIKD
jgi:uncharacterized protein (TIGR02145 family)